MSAGSRRWAGHRSGADKVTQLMSQRLATVRCRYRASVHDMHKMPAPKSGVQD